MVYFHAPALFTGAGISSLCFARCILLALAIGGRTQIHGDGDHRRQRMYRSGLFVPEHLTTILAVTISSTTRGLEIFQFDILSFAPARTMLKHQYLSGWCLKRSFQIFNIYPSSTLNIYLKSFLALSIQNQQNSSRLEYTF